MKKSVKITVSVIAIIIVLIASVLAVSAFAFKDKIDLSDKTIIGKTILFTHSTEKGEKLEIPISWTSVKISEDTYLVDIIFNEDQNSTNYSVKNARIVSDINSDVNILSAFYSAEGSSYTVPDVGYNDTQRVECFSDKGYVHLRMLLSGIEAKNSSFEVEYDIMGNGLYSFNKFHQTWEDLDLELE